MNNIDEPQIIIPLDSEVDSNLSETVAEDNHPPENKIEELPLTNQIDAELTKLQEFVTEINNELSKFREIQIPFASDVIADSVNSIPENEISDDKLAEIEEEAKSLQSVIDSAINSISVEAGSLSSRSKSGRVDLSEVTAIYQKIIDCKKFVNDKISDIHKLQSKYMAICPITTGKTLAEMGYSDAAQAESRINDIRNEIPIIQANIQKYYSNIIHSVLDSLSIKNPISKNRLSLRKLIDEQSALRKLLDKIYAANHGISGKTAKADDEFLGIIKTVNLVAGEQIVDRGAEETKKILESNEGKTNETEKTPDTLIESTYREYFRMKLATHQKYLPEEYLSQLVNISARFATAKEKSPDEGESLSTDREIIILKESAEEKHAYEMNNAIGTSQNIISKIGTDSKIEDIVTLIKRFSIKRQADKITRIFGEGARLAVGENYHYGREGEVSDKAKANSAHLTDLPLLKQMKTTASEIDLGIWSILRDQEGLSEVVSSEEINNFDAWLAESFLNRRISINDILMTERISLGDDLLKFQRPEIFPYAIINAFSEVGHNGNTRSTSIINGKSELFSYVESLKQENIDQAAKDCPDIARIVKLISENPETYSKDTIYVNRESQDNPVYAEIQSCLSGIVCHLLESASGDKRTYLIKRFEGFDYSDKFAEGTSLILNQEKNIKIVTNHLKHAIEENADSALSAIENLYLKNNPVITIAATEALYPAILTQTIRNRGLREKKGLGVDDLKASARATMEKILQDDSVLAKFNDQAFVSLFFLMSSIGFDEEFQDKIYNNEFVAKKMEDISANQDIGDLVKELTLRWAQNGKQEKKFIESVTTASSSKNIEKINTRFLAEKIITDLPNIEYVENFVEDITTNICAPETEEALIDYSFILTLRLRNAAEELLNEATKKELAPETLQVCQMILSKINVSILEKFIASGNLDKLGPSNFLLLVRTSDEWDLSKESFDKLIFYLHSRLVSEHQESTKDWGSVNLYDLAIEQRNKLTREQAISIANTAINSNLGSSKKYLMLMYLEKIVDMSTLENVGNFNGSFDIEISKQYCLNNLTEDMVVADDNWEALLLSFIANDGNDAAPLSPEQMLYLSRVMHNPVNMDFCLKRVDELWHKVLDLYSEGKGVPFNARLIVNTIKQNDGAGHLRHIEALSRVMEAIVDSFSRKTTAEDTKKTIISSLQKQVGVMDNKWSDDEKSAYFVISHDVLEAAPSLFTDFGKLFDSIKSPRQIKDFYENVYPLYQAELVMLQSGASKDSYNPRDLVGIRQSIDQMIAKINVSEKDLGEIFEEEKARIITHIKSLFKERFGMLKIPEKFGTEEVRAIKDFARYLGNIQSRDTKKESLLSFFLTLNINGSWNDFRQNKLIFDGSDKNFEISDYFTINSDQYNYIKQYVKEREQNEHLTARRLGINPESLADFQRVLQDETVSQMTGSIQTIDTRLSEAVSQLEALGDSDAYPDMIDKKLHDLAMKHGTAHFNGVLAKLIQNEMGRQSTFSFEESLVAEDLKNIELEDDQMPTRIEQLKNYQNKFKLIGPALGLYERIPAYRSQIKELKDKLRPTPEVIEIFNSLGEDFKNESGAVGITQDIFYLESVVSKNFKDLEDKGEIELVQAYLEGAKETLKILEKSISEIGKRMNDLSLQMTKNEGSSVGAELTQLKEIVNQIQNATIVREHATEIVSLATNRFPIIIENMRQCLACTTNGCNNDTNLTFGDSNKFYAMSQTGNEQKEKGSIADEIVFFEPVLYENNEKGIAFVLDRIYGNQTPDILLGHVGVFAKKYNQLKVACPDAKISIFVAEGAIQSIGNDAATFAEKIKELLPDFEVVCQNAEINIVPSGSGEHYIEVNAGGGSARVTGERNVAGIMLRRANNQSQKPTSEIPDLPIDSI